jgi:nucleotide-binding universal stress UspA family protein
MNQLMEVRKIIWAVDPFAEKVMLQRAAAWAIQELTQSNPSSVVQPVYLLNDFSSEGIIPQRLVRSFVEKTEAFANDSLSRITHRIPFANLKRLQVISRPFDSIEQGVQELLQSAERQGGHLIVVSTRAGKGGSSTFAFPGSFVEALSELSDLPLLVVNPKWKCAAGIPSIVFPSDLSPESHEWFLKTLEFAKTMGAKVTLFHKIDFPLSQPFDIASRNFPEIRDTLYRKIRASQLEAKKWAQIAKKTGVRLSVIVDSKMADSLSEAVLTCLAEHPGTVIIAPPLSVSYPRSTIRKLMKRVPYPMLYIPTLLRTEVRAFGFRKVAA